MNIGEVIKQIRKYRGQSLREFAADVVCSYTHICNVEHGGAKPGTELVDRIREATGIDPHILTVCLEDNTDKLPKGLQASAKALRDAWLKEYADVIKAVAKAKGETL